MNTRNQLWESMTTGTEIVVHTNGGPFIGKVVSIELESGFTVPNKASCFNVNVVNTRTFEKRTVFIRTQQ